MKPIFFKSFTVLLIAGLFLTGSINSCNSNNSKNNTGTKSENYMHEAGSHMEGHHHEVDEGHHHNEMHEVSPGEMMWVPAKDPFGGKLKLVKGNTGNMKFNIDSTANGNVLSMDLSGEEVVMMLDGKYGNLGAELDYKAPDYQGQLTLLFHYKDDMNYDAMVLGNHKMVLQRIENGKAKELDTHEVSAPSDWATLKISAAGEHLKCFLNGKQYNHGHAEVEPAGQVGIMLKGKGKVELKKLTVIPLEE